MHPTVKAFLEKLSYGDVAELKYEGSQYGVVETLARIYERARNALEYRADHLVRRAAIERILKRRIVFDNNPSTLTEHLLMELKWARYVTATEIEVVSEEKLREILTKYVDLLGNGVPSDWIIGVASAEIEELFNLNVDFKDFTLFTFQVIKQKVKIKDENLDLLLFVAIDKVYAESDDQQIAYHILNLAGKDWEKEELDQTYKLINFAKSNKLLPRLTKFTRRQMPPLILLRDVYFANPSEFKKLLTSEESFKKTASEVLENQLDQMSGRVSTASLRSIIYVFLTKMLIAFGIEVPLELWWLGRIAKLSLAINLVFPPLIMWFTTLQIRLPKTLEREGLVDRTWYVINSFNSLENEPNSLQEETPNKLGVVYIIFSTLYLIFFVLIFGLIFYSLKKIGFGLANQIIFVFFLSIVAFFAYRISQTAKVYSWKGIEKEKSSLWDILFLPILAAGSKLSQGLSKLNFLAFTFDFILEAPFKIILGFLDSWVSFLSMKKEEIVD